MRVDIHHFRIGTNNAEKRTLIFFYFSSSLFGADHIVWNGRYAAVCIRSGAKTGEGIYANHYAILVSAQ
ncbi:MAG: hypothetical protein ALMCE001_11350 [Methanocorpusculum sp. MCE]|nr:MAG: hypothetical protein ALMCE001_11350 [Methanocorpusculum sp. MCE]